MEITVERARADALEQVALIERESFTDPWTLQGFIDAFSMEQVLFLVAREKDRIVGYALMYYAADQGEIPTIAVDGAYRRRHVAEQMLQEIFHQAKKMQVKQIYLEARISNAAAIALYQHMGFVVDGKRRNFYQNPPEDAVVMCVTVPADDTE